MTIPSLRAVLFGSIGTIVETSELQRQAFNDAFAAAGLDWNWDRRSYQDMLHAPGGKARIELFARARRQTVDATAIHDDKTARFDAMMLQDGLTMRPGVSQVIEWAKGEDLMIGFATSTTPENVDAMLGAIRELDRSVFAFIGDSTRVERPKPDPAIYELALRELGFGADECVAVEDSGANLRAATSLGIRTIAFPGANALDQDYAGAALSVDTLSAAVVSDAFGTEQPG